MKLIEIVLIAAVAIGVFTRLHNDRVKARTSAQSIEYKTFVQVPQVVGQSTSTVLVLAALNCSKEVAQRADQLAADLSQSGIPVARINQVQYSFGYRNKEDLERKESVEERDRVDALMRGTLPIVFVHGRAKNNPTLEEVIAEYRSSTGSQ